MTATLLRVEEVHSGYGGVDVLHGVSMQVPAQGLCTVVGSNGAGKSTLLRTISGLMHPRRGRVEFDGRDITRASPAEIVHAELVHVAEGRRLFRRLSVQDNLELGLYRSGLSRVQERARYQHVYDLFPVLHQRAKDPAGNLSGGQQQMLAVGQALMRDPKLLMLDEPSLGLAPVIIDQVFDTLVTLKQAGTALLLVEQIVERALEIADYAYVMQNGRIVAEAPARALLNSEIVRQAYLGTAGPADRTPGA